MLANAVIFGAIAAGKHVVTANKALARLHGEEIFAAASGKGVDLGFEASVGGGIPVIRALTEGLAGQHDPIHLWHHQRDVQLYSCRE